MAKQTFTSGQVLTAAQVNALQGNDFNQTVTTKTANYTPTTNTDIGTRVIMNSASATTITINTSIYSAGDTFFISNIGAGVCTLTAGTCAITSAGPLAIPQYGGGTLYFTSASAAIYYPSAGPTASSGLTFISSTNASGNSFTISNCFSATYDNYQIQLSNITTASSPGKFRMRLGSGTAHAFNLQFIATNGAGGMSADSSATSGNLFNLDAGYTQKGGVININSPFLSTFTTASSLNQTQSEFYFMSGIETSSSSFTDITFSNANAVGFASGTVKIYGYSNS